MPKMTVNTDNLTEVRTALLHLRAIESVLLHNAPHLAPAVQETSSAGANTRIQSAIGSLRGKGVWPYLTQFAAVNQDEYSLPELAGLVGLSSAKVTSLKAILGKPEKRLGISIFEPTPSGSFDSAGNPRVRLVPAVREAILRIANGNSA